MKDKIYTIMVISEIKEDEKLKCPIFESSRIVGYYFDMMKAFDTVINNVANIYEYTYDYVLIEEIEPGLYNSALSDARWLFKFNRETRKYEVIDEPSYFRGNTGFSIG